MNSHKNKAMAAARRMAGTSRPAQTVRTWAAHMRAVIAEAAITSAEMESAREALQHEEAAYEGFQRTLRRIAGGAA